MKQLNKPATMASLMDQCRKLDARFDQIDISQIFCRHDVDDKEYSLNIEKVTDCLQIAQQTKGVVINKTR